MVQIRRFETEDKDAVKILITRIMDLEFKEDKLAFPQDDLSGLGDSYGRLGEVFFVAEDERKLIGTVGVKREDDRVALIRRIFVAPEYRKKQIGIRLMERALEFCREVGYRELVFKTTSRMQGAIELVKKVGFQSRAKVSLGPLELLKFSMSLDGRNSK